ncbi:hypothetical protein RFI_18855 [Reticulomyxa filosa]|uniref:Uncharacterized protein n=1 Tax=Reticulomyxa filosa TaxID=46433 RepID=X6MZD5_RETFI|nr:hypothetical protein RFI_18855 [Reticulomyxa filosa]|eukprot:ETO18410.1 hypothetical protein RFI_18855 [Reticulomyxa filosa]
MFHIIVQDICLSIFFFFLLKRYGSQFHPEKPMFEYARNVPKTLNAICANQYFAQFFVNECRIRNNRVMDQSLYQMLNIFNDPAHFVASQSDNEYQQMFLFPSAQLSYH